MAYLRTVVGGQYHEDERDVVLVQHMLGMYRSMQGKAWLPLSGKADGILLSAIEEFQRERGLPVTRQIANNDRTFIELHRVIGESTARDHGWERLNVDGLRRWNELNRELAAGKANADYLASCDPRLVYTLHQICDEVGGVATLIERVAVSGSSTARALQNFWAWLQACQRVGLSYNDIYKLQIKLCREHGVLKAFLPIFENARAAGRLADVLKGVQIGTGIVAVLAMLPKVCWYLVQGKYGMALGEVGRCGFALYAWPAAVFEVFEALLLWKWPFLANNCVFRFVLSFNPGRLVQAGIDILWTLLQMLFMAFQNGSGNYVAALTAWVERWESTPLDQLSRAYGNNPVVWVLAELKEIVPSLPIPQWVVDLRDYYENNPPKQLGMLSPRAPLPAAFA